VSDWENDIIAAQAIGIDAFALDMGLDTWQPDRIADAYTAAANVAQSNPSATPFKLFLSFDLSFAFTFDQILQYLQTYGNNPYQFMYNNKAFVSTFSGETSTLGYADINTAWQAMKTTLASSEPSVSIYFVPEWSALDPTTVFQNNPVMDGVFSWNAWYV
jgi:glucan endo-1,3-alpha-glucosidase